MAEQGFTQYVCLLLSILIAWERFLQIDNFWGAPRLADSIKILKVWSSIVHDSPAS